MIWRMIKDKIKEKITKPSLACYKFWKAYGDFQIYFEKKLKVLYVVSDSK
jgi:hypothetical protein